MFYVRDCEITYQNRVIARLTPLPLGFLREVEDTLRDFTTADDFDDEHREALKAEYDEGFEAGKKDGRQDAENALDDEREKIHNKGFELGRARALADVANASDAARVETLLQALQEMHNALLPLWHGFEEPGKFKRRPAKTSEIKSAAQACCSTARIAVNKFRGE